MESLAGKFLLAGPALLDPNFARTVVLIVRHDDQGAFGLVINRPLAVTVAEAISKTIAAAVECEEPVYSGGPCQGPVFILHTDPTIGGEEPVESVYVTTDREAIESLLQSQSEPLKLFASYSGWSKGQLENEMGEGGWLVAEARPEEIFSIDSHLWSRLHTRAQLTRYVNPDRIPDDPTVN